jgi:hypothetical protein
MYTIIDIRNGLMSTTLEVSSICKPIRFAEEGSLYLGLY